LSAQEAYEFGVVAEILLRGSEMARAQQPARNMSKNSRLSLRYTRTVLTHDLKRRMTDDLGYGLALEFAASAARRFEAAVRS